MPVLRISLALSAQLLVFARPEESGERSAIISAVLGLYAVYGIWLYFRIRRDDLVAARFKSWAHWIDVGWFLVLVCLSRGASSIYFVGFLFAVTVASFRWGFSSGLSVTIVSALSFAAVSAAPLQNLRIEFNVNLLLVRSTWLLGIGYLIAHWGDSEVRFRRRLGLISKLSGHANPRFGIDRTVAFILEHLKDFYGARSGMMVLADPDGNGFRLQRTGIPESEAPSHFDPLDPGLARRLLELSPEHAAVHNARPEGWWHFGTSDLLLDITLSRATQVEPSRFASLAAILDAKYFVTVPVQYRSEGIGRLFMVAEKPVFVPSDMNFLLRVLDHVNPIIENIRLVEQLATHAADEERRKIARDIHDSVIQPYLGLQMGLAAIREKTGQHFPELSRQIEKLMEIAQTGIDDLRRYVAGLKQDEESSGGLVPAMRRFAARFSEATGIAVEIETEGDVLANERLAAEAFQMMTEGLSNIRKHTRADSAKVRIVCRLGHLMLEIINGSSRGVPTPFFTPASITERTAALGGKVRVATLPDGGSSVIVDIPL
jgi:signal transduction histidine kinase